MLQARSISRDCLKGLALPTLVIWGRRDRVIPPDHGSLIAEHIPGARHVVINGVGHMPFYERPAEFNRYVLDFLR
jgi:pimeloyl-ACP methyl ester carboxylesterase